MGLLSFYTLGSDEDRFVEFALHDQGLVLIAGVQSHSEVVPMKAKDLPAPPEQWWQRIFLAPSSRTDSLRYRKAPTQNYFTLDGTGPVIAWTRSGINEGGRLVRGSLSLNSKRKRPHELDLAYRRLESWIRSQFRKIPAERIFAGPEAFGYVLKGGKK